jgi:hypothetical protein
LEENSNKHCYFKVGEKITRTLAAAVNAKWAELIPPFSMRTTSSKPVRIPPGI